MKNAGIRLLFVSVSSLLLTACASQAPVRQAAPASAASTTAPSDAVAATRYKGTRRVTQDGVDFVSAVDNKYLSYLYDQLYYGTGSQKIPVRTYSAIDNTIHPSPSE